MPVARKRIALLGAACAALVLLMDAAQAAGTLKVLYAFQGPGADDGQLPYAAPLMDSKGDLYGTTYYGGSHGLGTVYRLHRTKDGAWKETVLHSFAGGSDGSHVAGGVVMDSSGNLYGGTEYGGDPACGNGFGCGVVYQLTPGKAGAWTETVLYNFPQPRKGSQFGGPLATLTLDGKDTLYGTTVFNDVCKGYNYGSVFKLKHVQGVWKENDIHKFCFDDGEAPEYGALVLDGAGNIFGTAAFGGPNYGDGVVFELSPSGHNTWTFTHLHDFNTENDDGGGLAGGITLDSAGNIYGANGGGPLALGAIYELSPSGGTWTESILYAFNGSPDGQTPFQNPIFDASGNLWGTTYSGGQTATCQGCGVIYKLVPKGGGQWSEKVVYNFATQNGGADGYNPLSGLIADANGNFYGTTTRGGNYNLCGQIGCGVVYEFTP
jgi:uncharacterized repeat protein (TIGR03803 family)